MHFSNTPAPRPSGLLRVASVNVTGLRAAYKKDMAAWLASRDIDILCLQEVRAREGPRRRAGGDPPHPELSR